jgi:hypothetical protein
MPETAPCNPKGISPSAQSGGYAHFYFQQAPHGLPRHVNILHILRDHPRVARDQTGKIGARSPSILQGVKATSLSEKRPQYKARVFSSQKMEPPVTKWQTPSNPVRPGKSCP